MLSRRVCKEVVTGHDTAKAWGPEASVGATHAFPVAPHLLILFFGKRDAGIAKNAVKDDLA
jgi:hypothetical protein